MESGSLFFTPWRARWSTTIFLVEKKLLKKKGASALKRSKNYLTFIDWKLCERNLNDSFSEAKNRKDFKLISQNPFLWPLWELLCKRFVIAICLEVECCSFKKVHLSIIIDHCDWGFDEWSIFNHVIKVPNRDINF